MTTEDEMHPSPASTHALDRMERTVESFERILIAARIAAEAHDTPVMDALKSEIESHGDLAAWTMRHNFQCLKMRDVARRAGDLRWYMAATMGCCQNARLVIDDVDWEGWAETEVVTGFARYLVFIVALWGPMEEATLVETLAKNTGKAPQTVRTWLDPLLSAGTLLKRVDTSWGPRVDLGPLIPRPR